MGNRVAEGRGWSKEKVGKKGCGALMQTAVQVAVASSLAHDSVLGRRAIRNGRSLSPKRSRRRVRIG
jgi:hypothetical protein